MKIDKKNKNASEMTPLTPYKYYCFFLLCINNFTYDSQ